MSKIKIVFFGTQDFAAVILEGLLQDPKFSVEMVFTQPDRKVGRKQILEQSAVKKLALRHNLTIKQPETLKNFSLTSLTDSSVAVVAQYGLIIPKSIIDSFSKGIINVHGSLLPKYRGASPIQEAIKNGETLTGVTIMLMDEQVDHGPILSEEGVTIGADDTFTTLSHKMAAAGSTLLLNTLPEYMEGEIIPQVQDHSLATFTKLIHKDDGRIDFSQTADQIYNLYRAYTPWPGIWCMWADKRLKLLKIARAERTLEPGTVLIEHRNIFIGCGQHAIKVLELQLEGKIVMSAGVFANGYKNFDQVHLL
ncbi:MAG: methionyl-tRNA formyltransferase [Candidatus Magasanikbacteria bacterium]|nr:methionyl-tRNA formyltransferase [Candidatus Magasanikbacteria bacterium]